MGQTGPVLDPLSAEELLTTTRAVRKRLDLSRPVSRQLVQECLEMALQAPTGSNAQGWRFVVVDDPEPKRALADCYGRAFDAYVSRESLSWPEGDPRAARQEAVLDSAAWLRHHLHEVPTLVVPCGQGRLPEPCPVLLQASWWGSILPAVWSFMLAARLRGLGTCFTTLHLAHEREAAEALGVPYGEFTQAGLVPVANTLGGAFRRASRLPVSQVVHWNRW